MRERDNRPKKLGCLNVVCPVVIVFFAGRPLTVIFGVVLVVINPVNLVFNGRLFAHIFQKARELLPRFWVGYTSTAVPVVSSIIRVFTSLFHRSPRVIFRPIFYVRSVPIVGVSFTRVMFASTHFTATSRIRMAWGSIVRLATDYALSVRGSHNPQYNVNRSLSQEVTL